MQLLIFLISVAVVISPSFSSKHETGGSNKKKYLYPYPPECNIPNPLTEYGMVTDDGLVINTHSGVIQGQMMANIRTFRSIPFAAPPIDNLRWQNPQVVTPWGNNTLDATSDPPGCPQSCDLPPHTCPPIQSEDCLFLNIFTPSIDTIDLLKKEKISNNNNNNDNNNNNNDDGLLNVFVFIHGGNFKQGYSGGLVYNGTEWVNLTNTIIVTVNYRLGVLGNLWSVEAGMTGNYGFLDQKLALKWVYDNIEYFGGNNKNVTLFGQSAGAVSVALHMSQTSSDDSLLFQYGIMESEPFGTPLRDTITWGALPKAFFGFVGCNLTILEHDNVEFWDCLRAATVSDVIKAQDSAEADTIVEAGHFMDLFMPWTPTVGSDLFAGQPLFMFQQSAALKIKKKQQKIIKHKEMLKLHSERRHKGRDRIKLNEFEDIINDFSNKHNSNNNDDDDYYLIRDMPFIIGTVMNEGNEFIYMAYPNGLDREQLDQTLVILVGPEVALGIREHYPLPSNTTDYRDYVSLIATDGLFKCATRNVTASHDSNGFKHNVFMYHFDHISSFNVAAWGKNYSECYNVVCHGSELLYVFRPNLGPIDSKYTDDEWELAKTMQIYWSTFGENNGISPGSGGNINNVEWEPFVLGSEMSLLLQSGDIEMQSNVDMDNSKCQFWDSTGYSWLK